MLDSTNDKSTEESSEVCLTHLNNCKKNEAHKEFIPIKEFNQIKLQKYILNDKELTEHVHATTQFLSRLTVRISVQNPSQNRTDEYNLNKECCPLSERASGHQQSPITGSGVIFSIHKSHTEKENTPCVCKACKVSGNPKRVWWEISFYTAAHVVYDENEAKSANCTLYFDEEGCPGVNLVGMDVINSDKKADRCRFVCATCDLTLVTDIKEMLAEITRLTSITYKRFKKVETQGRLVIIVSHPHGCSKHVSLGKVTQVDKKRINHSLYFYDNSTCGGSSGAFVYVVGNRWNFSNHVHCKSFSLTRGQSSLGYSGSIHLGNIHNIKDKVKQGWTWFLRLRRRVLKFIGNFNYFRKKSKTK